MSGKDYPRYVERPDGQAVSQPLALDNVTLYGFPLASDIKSQQAILDKFLNAPSGGAVSYKAFSPQVLLYFASLRSMRALGEPDRDHGVFQENECGVWIPAVSVKKLGPVTIDERLAIFPLYTFMDDSYAMASGREIYGFPKQLAQVSVPADPSVAASFSVRTGVFDRFGPRALCGDEQLIRLEHLSGTSGGLFTQAFDDATAALEAIVNLIFGGGRLGIPGVGLALSLVDTLLRGPSLVFLKQFRDAARADRACYQAVIEAGTKITAFRRAGILEGTYDLYLKDADSHPIASQLGLAPGAASGLRAFFVAMDFNLGAGREVWRAG